MRKKDDETWRYLVIAGIPTFLSLSIAAAYIGIKWEITFAHLHPHEWGEFIAGWSALLAFIWASTAVLLQRKQFVNEMNKLGVEAERAKEEAATAYLAHLLERLGREMERLAQICEECELHKGEEVNLLSDIVVRYQVCTNLARSEEYPRLLNEVANGLEDFISKVNDAWVIGADGEQLEDLAVEMDALKDLITEIAKTVDSGATCPDAPNSEMIIEFKKQIDSASECVNGIQKAYNELGT